MTSLRAHSLRSTLSILGILFGVASITAMSSVTEGARLEALAQIGDLGVDTLVARSRSTSDARVPRRELSIEDFHRLQTTLPNALAMAPIRVASLVLLGPSGDVSAMVIGTTDAYASAARSVVARGRLLTSLDIQENRRVAVIGAEIAAAMFPETGGLSERIRVGDDVYEVVGVLEARAVQNRRSSLPILGRDLNQSVVVPWESLVREGTESGIDEILIRLNTQKNIRGSAAAVRRTLELSLGRDGPDVVIPVEVIQQQQRTQDVFSAVTGATSLICLLVGGVGIMNILLATVSERVPEIGIRRAVGATREEIAAQFIAEGTLLSSSGGLLGLLIGAAATYLIQRWTSWPMAASPVIVATGFLASVMTGVIAGGYPAWKAAHLQVMDALRRR